MLTLASQCYAIVNTLWSAAAVCFCNLTLFSEMLNKVTSTMVDGGGQGAGEQVENLILQLIHAFRTSNLTTKIELTKITWALTTIDNSSANVFFGYIDNDNSE